MTSRRQCLSGVAACLAGAAVPVLCAPSAAAKGPADTAELAHVDLCIPAGAGGGWDQTGRALGAALQSGGLVGGVGYENKGGQGGILGLEDFVQKRGGVPNAMIVGGLVMVGAIAVAHPAVTMKQLAPIARLTSDYMVLAVAKGSPLKSLAEVSAAMRKNPAAIAFAGGSAGGVDHMLAGMVARALRVDVSALKYVATSSGKEAVAALAAGRGQVVISGYSELKAGLADQSLVPLAISSKKALFGIPSLREQGIDTELANWRGVFAHGSLPESQRAVLRRLVVRATETPVWRQALLDNHWVGSLLYGPEFEQFVAFEEGIAAVVTGMLKLRA